MNITSLIREGYTPLSYLSRLQVLSFYPKRLFLYYHANFNTTAINSQEYFARSSLINASPIESRKTAGTIRARRVSRRLR